MTIHELLDGLRLLKAQTQPVMAFGSRLSDKLYGKPMESVLKNAHRCADAALTYIEAAENPRYALENGADPLTIEAVYQNLDSIALGEIPEAGPEVDLS